MSTNTSLVVTSGTPHPVSYLRTYPTSQPIGSVHLDGGNLVIQASDPAHLRLVAEALTDAARMLADELDRDAARAVNAEQVSA